MSPNFVDKTDEDPHTFFCQTNKNKMKNICFSIFLIEVSKSELEMKMKLLFLSTFKLYV
jgi:hypothetical protein